MRKLSVLALILCLGCLFTGCSKQCAHQVTSAVTKEATCQETGIKTYTCELCGAQFMEITPKSEHTYVESVTREATCTEAGVLTYTCSVCGAAKEESTAMGEHVFDVYSLDPDRCTVCGQVIAGAGTDTGNPWYGKKWVALGTSLTSEAQGKFVQPLAARSGLEVTNLGVPGGTAIAHVLQNAQASTALADADLVTIEFGVNDWYASVPLGTVGDTIPYWDSLDQWDNGGSEAGSFAGACYQIFKTVQENAPNAVVVFITQPTGRSIGAESANCSRDQINYLNLRQIDYTNMAVAVAGYMGIRVIDAGSASMINQEHPQYLEDQIHHTELGGKQYALTIWMELKDIPPLQKEG